MRAVLATFDDPAWPNWMTMEVARTGNWPGITAGDESIYAIVSHRESGVRAIGWGPDEHSAIRDAVSRGEAERRRPA